MPKRPRDFSQAAKLVIEVATAQPLAYIHFEDQPQQSANSGLRSRQQVTALPASLK
jgi:hypothetical protein